MPETAPEYATAFTRLERQLFRRRLAGIEWPLKLEIAALGTLAVAFLFWRVRLLLAALAFARGAGAAAGSSAAALAALALLGGALAGARHRVLLAALPGPPRLALPLPSGEIHRHLARTSRVRSLWAALPALAILIAGVRIVPGWALPALAIGFGVLLDLACRLGSAIAFRVALRRAEECEGCDPGTRVLAVAARPVRAPRLAAPRWRSERPLVAFLRKDLPAPHAFFTGTLLTALAIGVLGANYGITLFPRADHAERVLGVALAVAIAASLMIPLLGWSLLLAALLHSARRLPLWVEQEAA